MAELVGAVASGAGLVSLAMQLTQNLVQLREFYKKARSARERLEETVLNLETSGLLLQQISGLDIQHGSQSSLLLQRCISSCEKSVTKIACITNKIEVWMKHSKYVGAGYGAYKDKDINDVCNELQSANVSLMLALQLYSETQRRLANAESVQILASHSKMLTQLTTSASAYGAAIGDVNLNVLRIGSSLGVLGDRYAVQPSYIKSGQDMTSTGIFHTAHGYSKRRGTGTTPRHLKNLKYTRKVWMPAWLTSRVWHVACGRSYGNWSFHLWTYNIQPTNAAIFRCVENYDIEATQKMFQSGQASPLDCDESGYCLPVIAATAANKHNEFNRSVKAGEMFRFLLQQIPAEAIVDVLVKQLLVCLPHDGNELIDCTTLQTAMDHAVCDPVLLLNGIWIGDESMSLSTCKFHISSERALSLVLSELPEPLAMWPLEQRFKWALDFIGHPLSPKLLFKCFGLSEADIFTLAARVIGGTTFFHTAAQNVPLHETWATFTKEIIRAGAKLCPVDEFGTTPLMTIFENFSYTPFNPESLSIARSNMDYWLDLLCNAGVNLQSYGKMERDCWTDFNQTHQRPVKIGVVSEGDFRLYYELLTLHYGAHQKDWSFAIRPIMEVQVWQRVNIPGSWTSEHDPELICWDPDNRDGKYIRHQKRRIVGRGVDLREAAGSDSRQPKVEPLFDGVQDEAGYKALTLHKLFYKSPRYPRRSVSQPRSIPTRHEVGTTRYNWDKRNFHIRFHRCLYDQTYRAGREDLRVCAGGHSESDEPEWNIHDAMNRIRNPISIFDATMKTRFEMRSP